MTQVPLMASNKSTLIFLVSNDVNFVAGVWQELMQCTYFVSISVIWTNCGPHHFRVSANKLWIFSEL